jgi:hypothetical protein
MATKAVKAPKEPKAPKVVVTKDLPVDPVAEAKDPKAFSSLVVKNSKDDGFVPKDYKELVVWFKMQVESGMATRREFVKLADMLLAKEAGA